MGTVFTKFEDWSLVLKDFPIDIDVNDVTFVRANQIKAR